MRLTHASPAAPGTSASSGTLYRWIKIRRIGEEGKRHKSAKGFRGFHWLTDAIQHRYPDVTDSTPSSEWIHRYAREQEYVLVECIASHIHTTGLAGGHQVSVAKYITPIRVLMPAQTRDIYESQLQYQRELAAE